MSDKENLNENEEVVEESVETVAEEASEEVSATAAVAEEAGGEKKKSGKGKKVLLFILMIPVYIILYILKGIWAFIKALIGLFGIAVGDSSAGKAFKRGYSGDDGDAYEEYTFTNDMGCTQTVYSSDGRNFYDANGSFVGTSDDGGKHIDTK